MPRSSSRSLAPLASSPPPLTAERIHERALKYLDRYASSVSGLRRVLQRGLLRDRLRGATVPEEASRWIEETIGRLVNAGLLDDEGFAEIKTHRLRRSGHSARRIRQKLFENGLPEKLVTEALHKEDEEGGTERAAALTLARKRRLGVYSPKLLALRHASGHEERAAFLALRAKHLFVLARAGFSHTLARSIVDAESIDAAEQSTADS